VRCQLGNGGGGRKAFEKWSKWQSRKRVELMAVWGCSTPCHKQRTPTPYNIAAAATDATERGRSRVVQSSRHRDFCLLAAAAVVVVIVIVCNCLGRRLLPKPQARKILSSFGCSAAKTTCWLPAISDVADYNIREHLK